MRPPRIAETPPPPPPDEDEDEDEAEGNGNDLRHGPPVPSPPGPLVKQMREAAKRQEGIDAKNAKEFEALRLKYGALLKRHKAVLGQLRPNASTQERWNAKQLFNGRAASPIILSLRGGLPGTGNCFTSTVEFSGLGPDDPFSLLLKKFGERTLVPDDVIATFVFPRIPQRCYPAPLVSLGLAPGSTVHALLSEDGPNPRAA
jgi:hypothetical protein